MKKLSLRDHAKETQIYLSRTIFSLCIIFVLLAVVITRMLYLQLFHHEQYKTLADNNRIDIIPLAPTRGLIYSTDGKLLAENHSQFSLEIVRDKVGNLDQVIQSLGTLIPINEDDIKRFKRLSKQHKRTDPVPLRTQLNDEELARFAVERHRFPGVDIHARLKRYYPFKDTFSHALGYMGQISERELQQIDTAKYSASRFIGKSGVEKHYEDLLHGEVGHQNAETDARGRVIRIIDTSQPKGGSNLTLTLDTELQKASENLLLDKRGAIVAIDPSTGGVLAMVSSPSYDPNVFSKQLKPKEYKKLKNAPYNPLFNRALRGRYPPGSTIKPFMALAGLEGGVITPSFSINDPGYFKLPSRSRPFRDWKRTGHGRVKLDKAIYRSCDTYFYIMAFKLGIRKIHAHLSEWGFGVPTEVDCYSETQGVLPSPEWKRRNKGQAWYPGETVIAGIGQGYMLITPIQLAASTAALANQGKLIKPHLLKKYSTSNQNNIAYIPEVVNTVTLNNPSHLDHVIDGMEKTVHQAGGTAFKIGRDSSYRIAGKTGTAQVFSLGANEKYNAAKIAEELRDHALFVAFAPIDDPKIALAVIIENGGSGAATPIAKAVMDNYLLR